MNIGVIDKENITEAFANVKLFSPSRPGGSAKHSGGALERSSKTHAAAPSSFRCSAVASHGLLSTPAQLHSIASTSSSDFAFAPKRAIPSKKSGLSERARRPHLFTSKETAASAGSGADAQLCSAGISKSSSAITWNQRSRGLVANGPAPPSAFASPKNLKRGVACVFKRSPAAAAPHNSPQRGSSSLLDGCAVMMIEEDMLSASLALSGVAQHLRLPRVVQEMDGMFGEADAELALLVEEECGGAWQDEESMGSGRHNPVALQLRGFELARMHAQPPQEAIYVQARRS